MNRSSTYDFKIYLPWIASCLLLLLSGLLFVLAFNIVPTDAQCIRHNFVWSPALDEIKYSWETFADTPFLIESKFFGPMLSQEIEDAWEDVLVGMS